KFGQTLLLVCCQFHSLGASSLKRQLAIHGAIEEVVVHVLRHHLLVSCFFPWQRNKVFQLNRGSVHGREDLIGLHSYNRAGVASNIEHCLAVSRRDGGI